MSFPDRLTRSIAATGSVLCAGIDPQPEAIPQFLQKAAGRKSRTDSKFLQLLVGSFYGAAIEALKGNIAALKPNIAFFEQYGVAGLQVFSEIIELGTKAGIPVIADAKRGDIGSTAQAYSSAFLSGSKFLGRALRGFEVDAVTVSPFLGFDTLEPFIKSCEERGKGIFVLVKTSNPGSKDLQDLSADGRTISVRVAEHLAANAARLSGALGYSGLGAVVGATHPSEAKMLRSKMPTNYFLIPGYGAQGGTAEDAVAGFTASGGGGVVNVSRALFGAFPPEISDVNQLAEEIIRRSRALNAPIKALLPGSADANRAGSGEGVVEGRVS